MVNNQTCLTICFSAKQARSNKHIQQDKFKLPTYSVIIQQQKMRLVKLNSLYQEIFLSQATQIQLQDKSGRVANNLSKANLLQR